jgi:seryl-tRNA synthetase
MPDWNNEVPDVPVKRLFDGGWFGAPGVTGAYTFTPKFERVVSWVQGVLTETDPNGSAGPHLYPPVMPRHVIERAGYAEAFPHLLGLVRPYQDGETVTDDAVLVPAVCYAVYQQLADSSIDEPRQFDIVGYCYRHEATAELGRFRSFRVRDFVIVADADTALRWRDDWIGHGKTMFARLQLPVRVQPASDPFFGSVGRIMQTSQVMQELKWEFVVPVSDDDPGTAIASANSHKNHLGMRFGIGYRGPEAAHSACIGFGLDRIALALIHAHGDDLESWPEPL